MQSVNTCHQASERGAVEIACTHTRSALPVVFSMLVLAFGLILALLLAQAAQASQPVIADFLGRYAGSVEVTQQDGTTELRDLSVVISDSDKGFAVQWGTVIAKEDGRRKEKSYEVEFISSDRDGIYAAAMQRNVFGHEVQQDPMKGEPYVWARLTGDTLTVFSMFIHQNGDYEMQQYDRSLTPEGLFLVFTTHRNGYPMRRVKTSLTRQ